MDYKQLKGETVQVEFITGMQVIGKFVEEDDDVLHLKKAFKVMQVRIPDEEGKPEGRVGIQWVPFPEEEVFVYKHAIMLVPIKCNEQINQIYLQKTSNLTVAKNQMDIVKAKESAEKMKKFKMGKN